MRVLVTGAAGFIGFHLSNRLLSSGVKVLGLDNLNSYYDTVLKQARLQVLRSQDDFSFEEADLVNGSVVSDLIKTFKPDYVCHLAAQAGVRYSKKNPQSYIDSNITGFLNILEGCRHNDVSDLFYASSSSVYGGNETIPFSEADPVTKPTNIYAVTKRSNEMMAEAYNNLYGINSIGLRFFTVYGPWGRPDMAYYFFTQNIFADKAITVFNEGKMSRDFTYIDDIVDGIVSIANKHLGAEQYCDFVNLGNNKPEKLMTFINELETAIGKKAIISYKPAQAEEMIDTWANIDKAKELYNYSPKTSLKEGLKHFVEWYTTYENPKNTSL